MNSNKSKNQQLEFEQAISEATKKIQYCTKLEQNQDSSIVEDKDLKPKKSNEDLHGDFPKSQNLDLNVQSFKLIGFEQNPSQDKNYFKKKLLENDHLRPKPIRVMMAELKAKK